MSNKIVNRRIVLNRRLEQETVAYNGYLTTKLSTNRLWIVNSLVVSLKQSGNWALIDRLWLLASETQQAALISLVNPSSTALSEVNAPAWVANQGYTFDGATNYLNTNVNLSALVNYTQNNAFNSVYSRTNAQSTGVDTGVNDGTYNSLLIARFTDDFAYARINNALATITPAGNANSLGFFSGRRTASAVTAVNKNGSLLAAGTVVSTGVPTLPMFIGCDNTNTIATLFCTRQLSIAVIGSASVNDLKLYNSIQSYMTSLGTQV